jgi:hypothetical protein
MVWGCLFDSTENANWQRIDGKAKILGVLVCVAGALIMALYKGPALLGDGFSDLNLQGIAVAGKPAPEPIGWLATLLIDAGVKLWDLGCNLPRWQLLLYGKLHHLAGTTFTYLIFLPHISERLFLWFAIAFWWYTLSVVWVGGEFEEE